MRYTLFLFISIFANLSLFAQETQEEPNYADLRDVEMEISALGTSLHNDTSLANRQYAANSIEALLQKALEAENTYGYPFKELEGVSLLQPEDKRFRIFTWELYESPQSYIQYGIVQTQEGKVFVLKDKSHEMQRPEFGRDKADNWYGALYYNIKAFKTNNQTQYLLFGRDSYSLYEHRKVLDVIYFDHKGAPRFGNNVIKVKDGYGRLRNVNRFLLQYSAGVYVKLNYDETQEMVVYDHLIHGQGIVEGQAPTGVPDGSYCGLKLTNGRWEYVDKVFKDDPNNVLVNDQNPQIIMNRKTNKRETDLRKMFGNSKKKKRP
jgi:hypothetical protein